MQGSTIALNLRFDDTIRTVESRGNDREAKEVMLRLVKELRTLNDGLVSRYSRLSAVNRTVVEILAKSQDGKAALMMRKAAELLVKVRDGQSLHPLMMVSSYDSMVLRVCTRCLRGAYSYMRSLGTSMKSL